MFRMVREMIRCGFFEVQAIWVDGCSVGLKVLSLERVGLSLKGIGCVI